MRPPLGATLASDWSARPLDQRPYPCISSVKVGESSDGDGFGIAALAAPSRESGVSLHLASRSVTSMNRVVGSTRGRSAKGSCIVMTACGTRPSFHTFQTRHERTDVFAMANRAREWLDDTRASALPRYDMTAITSIPGERRGGSNGRNGMGLDRGRPTGGQESVDLQHWPTEQGPAGNEVARRHRS